MNLILCNGFNYYNRIIKKFDTYTDYYDFMDENAPILETINFNPADGVNTSQVVNWNFKTPDYVVCVDENNNIDSRWFVIDSTRTRAGQLKLDLHRDMIADYYDHIIDSPMYIEKATVPNISDVAIYNKEPIQFNQIKTSESLIKDNTNVPWIVGYMASNVTDTNISVSATSYNIVGEYATATDFFNDIGYNGTKWRYIKNYDMLIGIYFAELLDPKGYTTFLPRGFHGTGVASGLGTYEIRTSSNKELFMNSLDSYLANNFESIKNKLVLDNNNYHFEDLTYNDKYVKIGNTIKKITVTATSSGSTNNFYNADSSLGTFIKGIIDDSGLDFSWWNYRNQNAIKDIFDYTDYTISLTDTPIGTFNTKISATGNRLVDAPYKMFAIPAGELVYSINGSTWVTTTMTKEDIINVSTKIVETLGTNCYDIQLLPFCPDVNNYWKIISTYPVINMFFDLSALTEGTDFDYIKDSNSVNKSFIVYPKKSTFTFDIENKGYLKISDPNTVEDAKVVNQCDLYRICSPNYASVFEFNPVRTGAIEKYNVDCTYKPYSPYIHVNPVWNKLYGTDYNDVRGLIIQGDFSLPIINDQWKQYQINNKNYLNAFNREIDSIELQNKYSRIGDVLNAGSSAIGTGVQTGIMAGPWAGVAATGASAIAGALDVSINEKLRNDALDLRKDQFNYSLDNIKALPKTLARISAFDANNKLFPVLEYYTCTDQEKDIFKNKMRYNGMTIGRIDKISTFLSETKNYIKGQIIRIEGLEEATHEFNAIAEELYKGVYI